MSIDKAIVILTILYLCYLVLEKKRNTKNRRAIKTVVHVNGTRGKSTVSRMIDASLRAGGYRVMTKTTGSSPRIINVDGSEVEIVRKTKPNIKEQIKVLNLAREQEVDVLVIECMAVEPYNQYVTERSILNSNIGVITNIRRDHLEEMGPTLRDIAYSLSNTVPYGGNLVLGTKDYMDVYQEISNKRSTDIVLATDIDYDCSFDFMENISTAMEVCRLLGVEDGISYGAIKDYKRDVGALNSYDFINNRGVKVSVINAMAANDPDSTKRIFNSHIKGKLRDFNRFIVIYNNRRDRAYRMKEHIELIKELEPHEVWITGEATNSMHRAIKRTCPHISSRVYEVLNESQINSLDLDSILFAIGNIHGGGNGIIDLLDRMCDRYE